MKLDKIGRSVKMKIEELSVKFTEVFGESKEIGIFFSPSRVNLIGEHVDYNGGKVFPCALTMGTYGCVAKRDDKIIRMYSENLSDVGIVEVSIEDLQYNKKHNWANYAKGVVLEFKERFGLEHGFDLLVYGNIPNGAGLSSSASLELLVSVIMKDFTKADISMVDMVKLSQKVENKYVGVNCGIMDQFAIGMGKADKAVLLDTNTLEYEYANIKLDGYKILIANTNKRRELADSKYNERRGECETGLEIIKQYKNINALCELTNEEFDELAHHIENEVIRRRVKHVVRENVRTNKAVDALNDNDLNAFGKLLVESHASLKDDYEVTGIELDTLVDLLNKENNIVGARMTGAGFGGCAVAIVKDEDIDSIKGRVSEAYEKVIGYKPTFYVVEVGDGSRKLQ